MIHPQVTEFLDSEFLVIDESKVEIIDTLPFEVAPDLKQVNITAPDNEIQSIQQEMLKVNNSSI